MAYRELINKTLTERGFVGIDPRHVEAFMRERHGTLDSLSKWLFEAEARESAELVQYYGEEFSESLAKSYGL